MMTKRQPELDWLDFCDPSLARPLRKTDLVSLLRRLDEEERAEIASDLEINGNKLDDIPSPAQMAAAMLESAEQQLQLLDLSLLDLLVEAAASREPVPVDLEDADEKIIALRSRGLLFSGILSSRQPVVVLPDEIRKRWGDCLQSAALHDQAARNTRILEACRGVLAYYGILLEADLYRIITQFGFSVDACFFSQLLSFAASADFYADRFDQCLKHPTLDDEQWLIAEQEARAVLPLRPLTLELVSSPSAVLNRPAFRDFRQYLTETGMKNDSIDRLLDAFLYRTRNGACDLGEEMCHFVLKDGEGDAEAFSAIASYVEEIRDQTPLWILKGHSPEEVRRLGLSISTEPLLGPITVEDADDDEDDADLDCEDLFGERPFTEERMPVPAPPAARPQKIGRNDPCPCGSGKKYKKCCGG